MNIQKMMKQAQAMQKQIGKMQAELADKEYEGTAGGGMVTVTINGKGELTKLKLDKSIVDPEDTEVLEDLIVAAFNKAKEDADSASNDAMSDMAGGLGLPPGFKLPF